MFGEEDIAEETGDRHVQRGSSAQTERGRAAGAKNLEKDLHMDPKKRAIKSTWHGSGQQEEWW